MGRTAKDYLDVLRGWLGYSESNGKYKQIIDIYNSHKPLARGYAVKYSDSWCDAAVSAAAIKAGITDLIGTECGCERHVDIFKSKGIWIEDGSIVPKPGYIVVYNWDKSSQPNDGFSDHIGVVESVSNGTITCIEGNKNNAVERRWIPVGWGYIRGYAAPKYEEETVSNPAAQAATTVSSGAPSKEAKWEGTVTADALNVRTWAGTEYPNLKSIPLIYNGKKVDVCDYVKARDGATWYYIRINGSIYGFVHSAYIAKA